MRKLASLLAGLGAGVLFGAALAVFFSPMSADELRARLQAHYQRALAAGHQASAERRAELEEELRELRGA